MTQFGVTPWLSNPRFAPPPKRIVRIVIPPPQKVDDQAERERLAKIVMEKILAEEATKRPLQRIAMEVAAKHGLISWQEMVASKKVPRLVRARHEFWFRAYNETGKSLTALGKFLGFDHTSVRDGIRRFREKSTNVTGHPVNCGALTTDVVG